MRRSVISTLLVALGSATPSLSMDGPLLVAVPGLDPIGSRTAPIALPLLAGRGGGASSPSEAADEARRRTGGQVLSVRKSRGGYEVKVLTPSGEVRMVFIPASGG
jgi:hypothetical protein